MGAEADDVVVPVAAGAGFGAGVVVLGGTEDVPDGVEGLRRAGFADFRDDAGAAVPRYGTADEAGGAGFDAAGVDVARTTPFDCAGCVTPSFLCTLTWLLSTGPDALRFSCGVCDGPFAPPAGRGTGLGTPADALGFGVVVVFAAVGSTMDMRSLKA